MTDEENRVADLIQTAFQGVRLGNGIGLRQGEGLDDYADAATLAEYRSNDEKDDWSRIPAENLNRYCNSLSFFDPEGMRFHLPAFLIADLEGTFRQDVVFHLTHFEVLGASRYRLFSESQRHAVRDFLLLCLSNARTSHNTFIQPLIERALTEYWTDSGDQQHVPSSPKGL